jgi:hypothetical protein
MKLVSVKKSPLLSEDFLQSKYATFSHSNPFSVKADHDNLNFYSNSMCNESLNPFDETLDENIPCESQSIEIIPYSLQSQEKLIKSHKIVHNHKTNYTNIELASSWTISLVLFCPIMISYVIDYYIPNIMIQEKSMEYHHQISKQSCLSHSSQCSYNIAI